MNTSKPIIRQLVQTIALKGVKYCVISPGSRNAPLVIAFNALKSIQCLTVIDERSAAFFALGIAQQSGRPVALVCTSGSALLNYAPAIAEAFYQKIPLLLLTGDRPPEWIDQDDGQTIRQSSLFANYVKASYTLPADDAHPDDLWFARRIASEAVNKARETSGPVHINVPLREPLYGETDTNDAGVRDIELVPVVKSLTPERVKELSDLWKKAHRRMVICGMGKPDEKVNGLLSSLAKKHSAAVLTETTSNMRDEAFVCNIDGYFERLTEKEKKELAPDLLITFGGPVTTKKFKAYLRKYNPAEHWHISPEGSHTDTYQSLTRVLPLHAADVLAILDRAKPARPGNYAGKIIKIASGALKDLAEYGRQIPFSDLKAFQMIWKRLPENSLVHIGNSTPIRYANLMPPAGNISYFANRGVSGIDGTMSTAAGAAFASGKLTTLIVGDLGFMYDLNALWNKKLPPNLRIIAINNGGGGIFRIIDSKSTPLLENYFEAAHFTKLEPFVKAFGVSYCSACDEESLREGLSFLYESSGGKQVSSGKPKVLEIFTPRLTNAEVLLRYFSFLKKKQL